MGCHYALTHNIQNLATSRGFLLSAPQRAFSVTLDLAGRMAHMKGHKEKLLCGK
nr:MAG TPA: hypothetical protein [Bacteriophage sp.]